MHDLSVAQRVLFRGRQKNKRVCAAGEATYRKLGFGLRVNIDRGE
jgi:hypothetical protein